MRDSDTIHLRSICARLESRQSREAANTAIYEVQRAGSALDHSPATTGSTMAPCVIIGERAAEILHPGRAHALTSHKKG
jgi:hypothetical protein